MHQHFAAPLVSQVGNLIAAADLVVGEHDVGNGGDVGGILGGHAGDQQDVVAAHIAGDLGEGGGGALDGLHEDDGLHVRVAGKGDQLGDSGLDLRGEGVGVGVMDHHVGVLLDQAVGGIVLFLTLRGGAGHDGDLVGGRFRHRHGAQAQDHQHGHEQSDQFLHVRCLLEIVYAFSYVE